MKRFKINHVSKKWNQIVIIGTCLILLIVVVLIVSVDPFFHYHKPLSGMKYYINNERYQNDGLSRNFDYSAILTGTSMTENFKTSDFERLYHEKAIKVPYSGGGYKEVNDNLVRAFDSHNQIDIVVRCLDYSFLIKEKDYYKTDEVYPTYLTNKVLFDDVSYTINKDILLKTMDLIFDNMNGTITETTSFDDYANWNKYYTFGKDSVLSTYSVWTEKKPEIALSEYDKKVIKENISQNVVSLAKKHPETIFYLFFSPYSICYWDATANEGKIDYQIEAEKVAIEELLKCKNIKLYSFSDDFDLVCNLNNYKDQAHYGEWVNTWILEWMKEDLHRLTKQNYHDYLEKITEFYSKYRVCESFSVNRDIKGLL